MGREKSFSSLWSGNATWKNIIFVLNLPPTHCQHSWISRWGNLKESLGKSSIGFQVRNAQEIVFLLETRKETNRRFPCIRKAALLGFCRFSWDRKPNNSGSVYIESHIWALMFRYAGEGQQNVNHNLSNEINFHMAIINWRSSDYSLTFWHFSGTFRGSLTNCHQCCVFSENKVKIISRMLTQYINARERIRIGIAICRHVRGIKQNGESSTHVCEDPPNTVDVSSIITRVILAHP